MHPKAKLGAVDNPPEAEYVSPRRVGAPAKRGPSFNREVIAEVIYDLINSITAQDNELSHEDLYNKWKPWCEAILRKGSDDA